MDNGVHPNGDEPIKRNIIATVAYERPVFFLSTHSAENLPTRKRKIAARDVGMTTA
jgi:hypothetical protein